MKIMNEIVMYMLAGACVVFLSVMLYSCDDKLDVRQDYDFSLSSWHLPSDIRVGEEVEIRLTLTRESDYLPAEYYIGYIQMEGKGEVFDGEGNRLVNREIHPLRDIPGLNRDIPKKQVFTLWYKSLSDKSAEIKFVVEDNFGTHREMDVSFDVETDAQE